MNWDTMNLSWLEPLKPIIPIPLWQKAAALAAVFVLILAGYIYFGWMPMQDAIAQQERQVEQQRILLKKNQALARDLPKKRKEYAKLQKQLKVALAMLPKKAEIPDLLENVSWAGKDSGLEFSRFQPQDEAVQQIYAEVPVALDMSGTYRQLLTFLKRVGEMPRIVSVRNLKIQPQKAGGVLSITGQAVTYRFVEAKAKKKRKRRRR